MTSERVETLATRAETVAKFFGWPDGDVVELALYVTDPSFPMTRQLAEGLDSLRAQVDTFCHFADFASLLQRATTFDSGYETRLERILAGAGPREAGSGA